MTMIVKKADQSVVSSITLIDDTELFATLGAGKTYLIICHYLVTSPSSTPDINMKYKNGNTGLDFGVLIDGNGNSEVGGNLGDEFDFTIKSGQMGDIDFIIRLKVSSGGDYVLQFMWAQLNSNANATTVLEGSTLFIYELD